MKNFIQTGAIVTVTAAAAVASGGVVILAGLIGVAQTAAEIGDEVAIVREGVFELPKATGEAWTVGATIYYDESAGECTTTPTDNVELGVALAAADTAATVGQVVIG